MIYVLYDRLRSTLVDWNVDWLFMVLDQRTFRALAAALLAFVLVVFSGPRVIRWLRKKKIGDTGSTDAESLRAAAGSKKNTPTMGGVLICGAIVVCTGLLADVRNFYVLLGLVVVVWLALLGGVDDWLKLTAASRPGGSRQGLYAWEKLVFQLGLGALVGYFVFSHGDNPDVAQDMGHVLSLPLQKTWVRAEGGAGWDANASLIYLGMPLFIVLAVLMVAGMSNAVNIADGMDGLAAGTTTIVAIGMIVLTQIAGDDYVAKLLLVPSVPGSEELLVLAATIAGACLGFLWWNCLPAQVFMGDTGSLALGGVLAYIAVVIRQELLLLIMSGVFLIEIASVVLQVGYFKYTRARTGTGQRLFKVAPIHHHFHISGWTEQQVVSRFWIVTSILVVLALAMIKVR
ncbi:MAG: phospho-N-acetylmuramoyl-pentapeptide-transferase [Phycisphaerales bacterium]|nr:phospho-N-acetylmuramoyl-pentapeptide-transferase [Phycisphaerales bacterium]